MKTAIGASIEMMKDNLALFPALKVSIPDRLKGNALMDDVRSHIDKMETEEDKLISIWCRGTVKRFESPATFLTKR